MSIEFQTFSEACERNKAPILEQLKTIFGAEDHRVLEVGSGTGQHGVHFCTHMPQLTWYFSDVQVGELSNLIESAALPNLAGAYEFNVKTLDWPDVKVDSIFTANTFHIMSWSLVRRFFSGLLSQPVKGLVVYGPFRYAGKFTSESNALFDAQLKSSDPTRGIRDFEEVHHLAKAAGFDLEQDSSMPANNQLIHWRRS